jgi:hypothetical protein
VPSRSGVLTAVDDRLISVRWGSGSESVFVPSAGSLRVTATSRPLGKPITPELPDGALALHPRTARPVAGAPILK